MSSKAHYPQQQPPSNISEVANSGIEPTEWPLSLQGFGGAGNGYVQNLMGLHALPSHHEGASSLPFQGQMEAAFGQPLSDLDVEFGSVTVSGADGQTEGDSVRFADRSPEVDTVAHEVAHALQHRMHGEAQSGHAVSSPTDAAEREAERATEAVAAGHPIKISHAPSADLSLKKPEDTHIKEYADAIAVIANSKYGKTPQGLEVVRKLQEMQSKGAIQPHDYITKKNQGKMLEGKQPPLAETQGRGDKMLIQVEEGLHDPKILAATLVHEATHAIYRDQNLNLKSTTEEEEIAAHANGAYFFEELYGSDVTAITQSYYLNNAQTVEETAAMAKNVKYLQSYQKGTLARDVVSDYNKLPSEDLSKETGVMGIVAPVGREGHASDPGPSTWPIGAKSQDDAR